MGRGGGTPCVQLLVWLLVLLLHAKLREKATCHPFAPPVHANHMCFAGSFIFYCWVSMLLIGVFVSPGRVLLTVMVLESYRGCVVVSYLVCFFYLEQAVCQRVLPKLELGRSQGTGGAGRDVGCMACSHLRLIVMASRCDGCSCTAVAERLFAFFFNRLFSSYLLSRVRFSVYTEKFTFYTFSCCSKLSGCSLVP